VGVEILSQLDIINQQIAMLGVLVLIGYITAKAGIITQEISRGLSNIVIKICLPLLIFTTVSTLNVTPETFKGGVTVLISSYIALIVFYLFGTASSKMLDLQGATRNVYTVHMMFGNIVYLGYPLFNSLFPGGEGILYAVFYHIASTSLMWTWGVYLINKHLTENMGIKALKSLINQNIIAFILGLIVFFLKLELPTIIFKPLNSLGGATTNLSMLFVGSTLAHVQVRNAFSKISIYILASIKMILTPLLFLAVFLMIERIFNLQINHIIKTVIVLEVAMPCMANVAIVARSYDSDYTYATECVFLTTIFSIFSLPLLAYIISIV
jgi:hypothetical protein